MPDPTPQDPWETAGLAPVATPPMDTSGRPVILKGAPPQPKEVKNNFLVDPNTGTAKPIEGLPPEAGKNPVSIPGHPGWFMDENGNAFQPKGLPDETQAFKVGDPDAINHAYDILGTINAARAQANAPLATGTTAHMLANMPLVGGLVGQNYGNLQSTLLQVGGDLRQLGIQNLYQMTGKKGVGTIARSNAEQQALQSSLAPLGLIDDGSGHLKEAGPYPDAATLGRGLDLAQNIYVRHLARLYGMNPDDPAAQSQIIASVNDPKLRQTLLQGVQSGATTPGTPPKDNGITPSGPPPLVGPSADMSVSGSEKAVHDPWLQKFGPQLVNYIASDPKQVSNAMIVGWIKNNGGDPANLEGLQQNLQFRVSPDRQRLPDWEPTYIDLKNVPLTGAQKVLAETTSANPGGIPVGAALTGAADTASFGAAPDVAGIVHGVTGVGPTRSDVVAARNVSADLHPGATLLGNITGAFLSPLAKLGVTPETGALAQIGRSAATGGVYGALSSDDPSISGRLKNALGNATIAGLTHGAIDVGGRLGQAGYRTIAQPVESLAFGPEATADKYALNAAARGMPVQDIEGVQAANAASNATGVPTPAAASINRAGQDYLARVTAASPAARTVVDNVAQQTRKAIPDELAGDFNAAIEAAAPKGVDSSEFLNRPVRDIATDIQSMASREYEKGIAPIAQQRLELTPDLTDALNNEQVQQATKDALNTKLDDATRGILRNYRQTLQDGGVPILSVDAARSIATALDNKAAKMAPGAPEAVQLGDVSGEIRQAIGNQFPEYEPVNSRYASRKQAIGALYDARSNFFASTPDQIDALNKSARKFTPEPNPPEFTGNGSLPDNRAAGLPYFMEAIKQYAERNSLSPTEVANRYFSAPENDPFIDKINAWQARLTPPGTSDFQKSIPQPLPSNRQLAGVGAREATQVAAGENGANTANRIANNVNQQANNATVLGSQGAQSVQAKAGARANIADTVNNIASGSTGDQVEGWFNRAKQLVALKATGGAHSGSYALAHAVSSVPGLSGQDAARVVSLYLDADSAPQVLQSLSKAYGARKARFIMARVGAVAAQAQSNDGSQ